MKANVFYIFVALLLIVMNTTAQNKTIYDFKWQQSTPLPSIASNELSLGYAGMISGVSNGTILVAGGANFPEKMPWLGGLKKYYSSIYLYQYQNGHLQILDTTNQLPFSLAYAACSNYNDNVVVVGGENEKGIRSSAFMINYIDHKVKYTMLPDLPYALTNAMIAIKGSQIFVLGGESENGTSAYFISLDLNYIEKGWTVLSNLPYAVSHAVVALQVIDGQDYIYLIGGRAKTATGISTFYDAIIGYNITTKNWKQVGKLPYPLSAGSGFKWRDDKIVLLGGDRGIVFNQVEKLIQAIRQTNSVDEKEVLNQQKANLQSTHPGFSHEMMVIDTRQSKVTIIGKTILPIPVTTSVVKYGDTYFMASGEIKAGVRSPYIFSFSMKKKNEK